MKNKKEKIKEVNKLIATHEDNIRKATAKTIFDDIDNLMEGFELWSIAGKDYKEIKKKWLNEK